MRSSASPWRGKSVLITAGPTREHLDPIRFLSNASSGRMGLALAREARRRGAKVSAVVGPCPWPDGGGIEVARVVSALEMRREVLRRRARADVVIAAAAVGDWRFAARAAHKVKRVYGPLRLTLIPNPDIIKEVARLRRPGQIVVGFALETRRAESAARRKLAEKGLDLVVANGPESLESGFSRATIVSRSGRLRLPEMAKAGLAKALLTEVERLWAQR